MGQKPSSIRMGSGYNIVTLNSFTREKASSADIEFNAEFLAKKLAVMAR